MSYTKDELLQQCDVALDKITDAESGSFTVEIDDTTIEIEDLDTAETEIQELRDAIEGTDDGETVTELVASQSLEIELASSCDEDDDEDEDDQEPPNEYGELFDEEGKFIGHHPDFVDPTPDPEQ